MFIKMVMIRYDIFTYVGVIPITQPFCSIFRMPHFFQVNFLESNTKVLDCLGYFLNKLIQLTVLYQFHFDSYTNKKKIYFFFLVKQEILPIINRILIYSNKQKKKKRTSKEKGNALKVQFCQQTLSQKLKLRQITYFLFFL